MALYLCTNSLRFFPSFGVPYPPGRKVANMKQREYGAVFKNLKGEQVKLCLPNARIPDKGLLDYTQCR